MTFDRNTAWGFSIFADDLREEVGGKTSIMGMYQSDLIVGSSATLPVILPKLVIIIKYYEVANSIKGNLKFTVELPKGDTEMPLLEKLVDRSHLPLIDPDKRSDEGDRPFAHLMIPFSLSPFPIFAEGEIKVRCHYDDGSVLKLGRLNLKILRPEKKDDGPTV